MRIELIEKTLARIDQNIMMANLKASFIMSANIIIIVLAMSGYKTCLEMLGNNRTAVTAAFFIMIVASVASLIMCLKVVIAFLASGNMPEKYRSVIYFGSISGMSLYEYKERIDKISEEEILEDYIRQIHLLSAALIKKYIYINASIYLFVMTPLTCLILFIIKLFAA
ncbi:MAG: Pycsar system effector family protein [bacterium]